MLFNVPQFIDIEDKIVGPLTAKQLGWLALGGVVLLVFYNFLDTQAFFLAAVICAGIFGALAFYKPYNQPLISFLMSSVYFTVRPRMYVWKRMPEKEEAKVKIAVKNAQKIEKKKLKGSNVEEISHMLDLKR